jgi:hypothetical protein
MLNMSGIVKNGQIWIFVSLKHDGIFKWLRRQRLNEPARSLIAKDLRWKRKRIRGKLERGGHFPFEVCFSFRPATP